MENEKFSISYAEPLMDIAGNILDVQMTQVDYDPIADRMVGEFLDKKTPIYFPSPEEHQTPMVFKYDNQVDYDKCIPKHSPVMREYVGNRGCVPTQRTSPQPSPQSHHHSPAEVEQSTPETQ